MVAKESHGHDLDFSKAQAKKNQVLVFQDRGATQVEEDDFAEPATIYQGHKEDSDQDSNTYAIMIFDKKKQGFRLVPVQSHFRFDKKAQTTTKNTHAQNRDLIRNLKKFEQTTKIDQQTEEKSKVDDEQSKN